MKVHKSFTFFCKLVVQRDISFYLTSIKASDLERLCAGLRPPESRDVPIDSDASDSSVDAVRLVSSMTASPEFASEVSRIESESYTADNPYQRLIDEARVRNIAAYLKEESSLMPNGVVLALNEYASCTVRDMAPYAEIDVAWEDELPMNIIDGQHRVEGLKLLIKDGQEEYNDFELPVSILVELPFYMQAELFAIINGKQAKVPRSRIYDLLGYRPIKDPVLREKAYRGEMAIYRFCHQAVRVLNSSNISPWRGRIKMRGAGPGIITQGALVDHLARLVFPRKDSARVSSFPLLYSYYKQGDLVGLATICVLYFKGVMKAWPHKWDSDLVLKETLFGKTNGIAVMFMVLHDLILLAGSPDKLQMDQISEFWQKVPETTIDSPPAGGSRGYQIMLYREIMEMVYGSCYKNRINEAVIKSRPHLIEIGGLY